MLNLCTCFSRPGGARRLVTFFCFAKRKSPKKRRAAVRATTRRSAVPCAARMSRKFQKLVCCAAFGHLKFSSVSSCAAQPCQNGTAGAKTNTEQGSDPAPFLQPRPGWAEQRRWRRKVGPNLFEPQANCLDRRRNRAAQFARNAVKGPRLRVAFLLGTCSLAKQRKVPRLPGRDPVCSHKQRTSPLRATPC